MKNSISIFLTVIFTTIFSFSTFAYSDSNLLETTLDEDMATYENFLNEQAENTDDEQLKEDINKVLEELNDLPTEEKEDFINILKGNSITEALTCSEEQLPDNISIEETKEEEIPLLSFTAASYTTASTSYITTITYTRTLYVYSIKVMEVQTWVKYTRSGGIVTSVLGGDAYTTRNFSANTFDWRIPQKWYVSDRACCETDCTVGIGITTWLDVDYQAFRTTVIGYADGSGIGYLTKL